MSRRVVLLCCVGEKELIDDDVLLAVQYTSNGTNYNSHNTQYSEPKYKNILENFVNVRYYTVQ